MANLIKYRRILSGTPVLNGMHDLWSQMNLLLGDFPSEENLEIWKRWKTFAENHLVFHPLFPGKVEAVKNVHVLQKQLAPFTFQISAEEVLDLPDATDLYRECDLEPKARAVYAAMEQQLYAEFSEHEILAPTALVKILRLAEIAGGFVHDDNAHVAQISRAKLELLRDTVEEIGNESFVVFCRFTAEREAAERLLAEMRLACGSLHGGQSADERARIIADLQAGRTQALVAMLQVASSSIDLSRARIAVYYSVGWSFGDYEQSRGRIRRHGQHYPQVFMHLVARDTIDEVIYKALARKDKLADAVRAWWAAQSTAA